MPLSGHTGGITTCAFSLNGKKIISGSKDTTLKIWDITTAACEHTLKGHSAPVTCVRFSADGSKVISGSIDSTIRIWDVFSGESLLTIFSGSGIINACAFYPDGKTICSSHSDNTIKSWDVFSGKNRLIFRRNVEKKILEAEKKILDAAKSQLLLFDKDILTLFNQGDYFGAVVQAKNARDFAYRSFGNNTPEYVTTIINLALLYRVKKEYHSLAESLFKEALTIQEGILGGFNPKTGEVYYYLGTLILARGNVEEARKLLNKAINIRNFLKEGWNEDVASELDLLITAIDEQNKRITIKKYHERGAGLPPG